MRRRRFQAETAGYFQTQNHAQNCKQTWRRCCCAAEGMDGWKYHENLRVLVINCYTEEYFVVFCAENVSVCGFNDNRNYNFFLESVLKNRVRIIYGCALYTGKYGIIIINSYLSLSQLYFTMMINQTLIEDITWLRRDAKKYFYFWSIWHLVFVFM